MSFNEFVDTLFDFARDPNKQGLYVQREDGPYVRIEILTVDKKIIVKMDDVEMGYFEEMTQQGYKCVFYQKYRNHIKDGLLPNERIMKSICSNPLVLFHEA